MSLLVTTLALLWLALVDSATATVSTRPAPSVRIEVLCEGLYPTRDGDYVELDTASRLRVAQATLDAFNKVHPTISLATVTVGATNRLPMPPIKYTDSPSLFLTGTWPVGVTPGSYKGVAFSNIANIGPMPMRSHEKIYTTQLQALGFPVKFCAVEEVVTKVKSSRTKAPTKAPVRRRTKAPVKAVTKAPVKAPKRSNKAPVKAPKRRTQAPTKAPKRLTKAPVKAPKRITKAPVNSPKRLTKAPVPTFENKYIETLVTCKGLDRTVLSRRQETIVVQALVEAHRTVYPTDTRMTQVECYGPEKLPPFRPVGGLTFVCAGVQSMAPTRLVYADAAYQALYRTFAAQFAANLAPTHVRFAKIHTCRIDSMEILVPNVGDYEGPLIDDAWL